MTPKITQRPFTHVRPRSTLLDGAIVHSMAELVLVDGSTIPAWDFLESEGLSVHALIAADGQIIEGAQSNQVANHAGVSRFQGRDFLNSTFLGAEFLVAGAHNYDSWVAAIRRPGTYTAAQYDAGGYLYAQWMRLHPAITLTRVVGHSDVSGDDVRGPGHGKLDPGIGFDWPRFRQSIVDWSTRLRSAAA